MEFESCRAYKIKGENGLCVGDKRTKGRCAVCPCYIREQELTKKEQAKITEVEYERETGS